MPFLKTTGRPYLMMFISKKVPEGVDPSQKNFKENTLWKYFEKVTVEDDINLRRMVEADLVYDILSNHVVKTRLDEEKTKEVLDYLLSKYKPDVAKALQVWKKKTGKEVDNAVWERFKDGENDQT